MDGPAQTGSDASRARSRAVDSQHRRAVAYAAAKLSELQNRASTLSAWCRSEVLRRVLTDIANELRDKGVLDEEEMLHRRDLRRWPRAAAPKSDQPSAEKA